jgi:hypothetical protein
MAVIARLIFLAASPRSDDKARAETPSGTTQPTETRRLTMAKAKTIGVHRADTIRGKTVRALSGKRPIAAKELGKLAGWTRTPNLWRLQRIAEQNGKTLYVETNAKGVDLYSLA